VSFSSEARSYVQTIDPPGSPHRWGRTRHMMIDYGLGVTTVANYELKRLYSDFFLEE
jgi:restriction endonuclease Mrr